MTPLPLLTLPWCAVSQMQKRGNIDLQGMGMDTISKWRASCIQNRLLPGSITLLKVEHSMAVTKRLWIPENINPYSI